MVVVGLLYHLTTPQLWPLNKWITQNQKYFCHIIGAPASNALPLAGTPSCHERQTLLFFSSAPVATRTNKQGRGKKSTGNTIPWLSQLSVKTLLLSPNSNFIVQFIRCMHLINWDVTRFNILSAVLVRPPWVSTRTRLKGNPFAENFQGFDERFLDSSHENCCEFGS